MGLTLEKYVELQQKSALFLEALGKKKEDPSQLQNFLLTNNLTDDTGQEFDVAGGGINAYKIALDTFLTKSLAKDQTQIDSEIKKQLQQIVDDSLATYAQAGGALPSAHETQEAINLALGETGGGTLSPTAAAGAKATVEQALGTAKEQVEIKENPVFFKENRLGEQAALILTMNELIASVDKGLKVPQEEDKKIKNKKYKNFTVIRYENQDDTPTGHFFLTNNFTKNNDMEYFFKKLPPQVLSLLIPTIRLYKTFYPIAKHSQSAGQFSKGYDWRIPFDDTPVPYGSDTSEFVKHERHNIEQILSGKGTFHSVGIKSFNYEYRGTDPSTVSTNIHATLEIFFQNPADLVREISLSFGDSRFLKIPPDGDKGKYQDISFSYSDLVNQTSRYVGDTNDIFNDKYYRIKAECGYANVDITTVKDVLSNSGYNDKQIQSVIKAISSSRVVLSLAPYSHDITFNEEGTVNLKINYNAHLDIALSSPDADLFAINNEGKNLRLLNKLFKQFLSEKKKAIDEKAEQEKEECKSEEEIKKDIEEFKKQYKSLKLTGLESKSEEELQEMLRLARKSIYNGIFNFLTGIETLPTNKKQDYKPKIYIGMYKPEILGVKSKDDSNSSAIKQRILNKDNSLYGVEELFNDKEIETLIMEPPTGDDKSFFDSLFPTTTVKKPPDDLASIGIESLDKRMEKYQEDKPVYRIKFVFLGDLLDIALECLNNISPIEDAPKIVVGNIPFSIPTKITEDKETKVFLSEMKQINPNLADIPISLTLLQEFLIENMVRPNLERYPVIQFIKDVVNKLIYPAIGPSVFGKQAGINASIKFSTSSFTFDAIDGNDPITGEEAEKRNWMPIINEKTLSRLEGMKKGNGVKSGKVDESKDKSGKAPHKMLNYLNYLFIVCTSKFPKNLIGDESDDLKKGVFHFRMGVESGIIKRINFEKMTAPYQREMIARREGDAKGTTIKQYYNSNIEMYGNNIFRPGDFIYIHPNYMFNNQYIVLQDKLGVGGYYLVINVKTDINETSFVTKLKCSFQGQVIKQSTKQGDEQKVKNIVKPINAC